MTQHPPVEFDLDYARTKSIDANSNCEHISATGAGGSGVVNVYGSASGITSANDQFWHQNSPGVENSAIPDDRFGFSCLELVLETTSR